MVIGRKAAIRTLCDKPQQMGYRGQWDRWAEGKKSPFILRREDEGGGVDQLNQTRSIWLLGLDAADFGEVGD